MIRTKTSFFFNCELIIPFHNLQAQFINRILVKTGYKKVNKMLTIEKCKEIFRRRAIKNPILCSDGVTTALNQIKKKT